MCLTNDIMINENKVTLRIDVGKDNFSIKRSKETFHLSLSLRLR